MKGPTRARVLFLTLVLSSCGPPTSSPREHQEEVRAQVDSIYGYLSDIHGSVQRMNVHLTKLCQEVAVTRGYTPVGAKFYCEEGER